MDTTSNISRRTAVKLVGAVDHPDFRDALALLCATARCDIDPKVSPELVIVAHARPGQVCQREIESLQRRWPLAGIVALLGSWCEGEIRTGRPWLGVKRFYWYEFPTWWRQQTTMRLEGHCPEWARPTTDVYRTPPIRNPKSAIRNRQRGLIHLNTANRNTADVLAEVLQHAGYATVWNPPDGPKSIVRGAVAGVWDGRQLDEHEVPNLAAFCHSLARDGSPVVALLDFPRRDRCDVAHQLGVTAVLGKPWINDDLVATIEDIVGCYATTSTTFGRAA